MKTEDNADPRVVAIGEAMMAFCHAQGDLFEALRRHGLDEEPAREVTDPLDSGMQVTFRRIGDYLERCADTVRGNGVA